MYVIGTFEHDVSLEVALKDIMNKGIEKKDILCIPLNKRSQTNKFLDTVHRSDGRNTMGLPFFLATSFSLFGGIYGFLWRWGPIIWGGLGFLMGFAIGLLIDYIIFKFYKKSKRKDSLTEVIVMVICDKTKEDEIVNVFWEQGAFGVAKLDR